MRSCIYDENENKKTVHPVPGYRVDSFNKEDKMMAML